MFGFFVKSLTLDSSKVAKACLCLFTRHGRKQVKTVWEAVAHYLLCLDAHWQMFLGRII